LASNSSLLETKLSPAPASAFLTIRPVLIFEIRFGVPNGRLCGVELKPIQTAWRWLRVWLSSNCGRQLNRAVQDFLQQVSRLRLSPNNGLIRLNFPNDFI
jgi:hypothetical protein